MGAGSIKDGQLKAMGIKIEEKDSDGDRKLKIPSEKLKEYFDLIKHGLNPGFWNEVIGKKEIIFIFKLQDGIIKEYKLSPDNEQEIDKLCAELNNEPPDKTANVYKYISENNFYHNFMVEHYSDLINRK